MVTDSEIQNPANRLRPQAIPLMSLFQIVTAASMFFACLTVSPELAIGLTIFITPALIRTTIVLDLMRQKSLPVSHLARLQVFSVSLASVLLLFLMGLAVFLGICVLFGFFGFVFSLMVNSTDLAIESTLIGVATGMIWGMFAGGLTMLVIAIRLWTPAHLKIP